MIPVTRLLLPRYSCEYTKKWVSKGISVIGYAVFTKLMLLKTDIHPDRQTWPRSSMCHFPRD